MILILLLAAAAFFLAIAAGFFSIVGLATTYAGSFAAVVALGSTIEFGKLVAVSFLYRFWHQISLAFKSTLIVMVFIVMIITSLGTFGFLTQANQTDMVGLKQTTMTQSLLQEEEARLTTRKLQIDQQIAQLSPDDVSGRVRLNRQFKDEIKEINTRLPLIAKEKAELSRSQIKQQADIGPLVVIAKSLGLDIDIATTWFTLLLVAVFDPLAVILTLCTNIAVADRQRKLEAAKKQQDITPMFNGDMADSRVPAPESGVLVGTIRFNEEKDHFEAFTGKEWKYYAPHDDNQRADAIPDPLAGAVLGDNWVDEEVSEKALPVISNEQATADSGREVLKNIGSTLTNTKWKPLDSGEPEAVPSAFPTMVESLQVKHTVDPDSLVETVEEAVEDITPEAEPTDVQEPAVIDEATEELNEDSATELIDLVEIAQGPQPTVDTTGIEQNTFGQPNRAAWDQFANLANIVANNRESRDSNEFRSHIIQLQAYVDELDSRTEKISDDEVALRSRIIAFIKRHQTN